MEAGNEWNVATIKEFKKRIIADVWQGRPGINENETQCDGAKSRRERNRNEKQYNDKKKNFNNKKLQPLFQEQRTKKIQS